MEQSYACVEIYTRLNRGWLRGTCLGDGEASYEAMNIDEELHGIPKLEGRHATLGLFYADKPYREVTGVLTSMPGGHWRVVEQERGIYTDVQLSEALPGTSRFLLQVR